MPTLIDRARSLFLGEKPQAPTQVRAALPPVSRRYGVPSREPTVDLVPKELRGSGGNPGQLDRMERGHPRIAAGIRKLELAVAAQPPVLVGADDETAYEVAFRETLYALLVGAPVIDAENGASGWSRLAVHLAAYWHRGASLFDAHFVQRPGAKYAMPYIDGLALELYPIHVSSIQDWRTESGDPTRLVGIRQLTTDGGPRDIDRSRLIHLQHGGAVGEWEGVSILRPLVFLFERWAGLMVARERNAHLQGGLMKVGRPAPVSDDEEAVLLAYLDAAGVPYILMPQGYAPGDVTIDYPNALTGNDSDVFTYIDAQIDRVFGEALQSLGSSAHGSRALGEELAAESDWQGAASLQALYDDLVSQVGEWLRRKVGYTGRLPQVVLDADSGEDAGNIVSLLQPAVTAGLITWSPDDESKLREQMGLGEREQTTEARTLLVGQIQAAKEIVASLNPTDPTVSPLAPVAALELLTAAGVPPESARSIINATLAASGKPSLPDPQSASPKPVQMAERQRYTVTDAEGAEYASCVEQLTGAETFVAWASLEQDRANADASMRTKIEEAAAAHRADVWDALADGWQPGEREKVRAAAVARYVAVLESYRAAVALIIGRHAVNEAERQIAAGLPVVPPGTGIAPSDLAAGDSRIDQRIQIVAEGMAGRVQTDVERAWADGATRRTFTPTITAQQLAAPALNIGSAVESVGRIEASRTRGESEPGEAPDGLRIVRVIRSSVADRNRCEHCRQMHGTILNFPEDQERFESERYKLPDPNCEGAGRWGNNCRCGWLIEWGRA